MEFIDFILWTDICLCLPLTIVVIFWVFCVVRREKAPFIYYINLLISNLIQFIIIIVYKYERLNLIIVSIYAIGLMVGLYFRIFIAMERCFVITRPQSNWIRHTWGSMLVSVLVWIFCIIILSLSMNFGQIIPVIVFVLLPAPLFIFFSAWTFKALPAGTSVPTDEKRRIVGTLVVLLIQYFLMILFSIVYLIGTLLLFNSSVVTLNLMLASILLSPYVDLILAFFMQKGSIDKLLSHLCCCIMGDTTEDVAGHQQPYNVMRERESEKMDQTV